MRGVLGWLLAGLPFDARSRRAIDETLLDWEGEATEAQGLAQVTGTALRGLASVLRVTSMSVLRESIDFSWCRGLGRRFRAFATTVAVLSLVLSALAVFDLGTAAPALGTLIAGVLALWFLPSALFLMIAWRPVTRSGPPLGAAVLMGLITMVAVGWLLPLVSDPLNDVIQGRIRALAAAGDPSYAGPPPRSPAPWPGVDIAGIVGLVAAASVFAGSIAQRSGLQSRWWLVGVPLIQSVGLALIGFAIGVLVLRLSAAEFLPLVRGLAMLLVAAVLIALSFRWRRVPEPDART